MNQLVSDKLVQQAFDWLSENRQSSAAAKALRIRAEYKVKQVRSKLFLDATGNNAEREAKAISSPEYEEAILEEIQAIEADEFHRNQRSRCTALIEAWRTEQSNLRTMAKVG